MMGTQTLTSNKQSSERLIVSFSEFSPRQSYHIWSDVENYPPRADKIKIVSAVSLGIDIDTRLACTEYYFYILISHASQQNLILYLEKVHKKMGKFQCKKD